MTFSQSYFFSSPHQFSPDASSHRRVKPTVQKEAAGGCAVIESVLWDAVPSYLRKLDAQCRVTLGKKFPVDATPIKFASWIGGDRDGNPNCTPEVTLEVVTRQRLRAAKMFLNDLNMLYSELAISSRFSKELEALAASVKKSDDNREKYRRVIGHLRRRLVRTVKECEAKLHTLTDTSEVQLASAESAFGSLQGWEDVEPIIKSEELMTPLRIMYDSLVETGFELVADGHVSDIIRRVAVFGMTLVPLDIREESTRHTIAIDAITRHLGIGSYKVRLLGILLIPLFLLIIHQRDSADPFPRVVSNLIGMGRRSSFELASIRIKQQTSSFQNP